MLVTHGNLAREFVAVLERVVGAQKCVSAVCIGADDDMERRRADILERARACDTGDGVIMLTDMFGGTPSNLAISITEQARIEVIAGANLPMLVKLVSVRNQPIAEAASGIFGRPPRERDFQRQYSRNPARCHRMTVSGWIIVTVFNTDGNSR